MTRAAHPARAAGFSLIEALIAAAILLIISLGLIPLFARSIADNTTGADSTQATNHGKTQLEELIQVPFGGQDVTVPAGANLAETRESWAQGDPYEVGDPDEGWWPGQPTDKGTVLWERVTRVRQYSVSDLDDGKLDNPLPGGTQASSVQLKEIEVELENPKRQSILRGGSGGGTGRRELTLRMIKAF